MARLHMRACTYCAVLISVSLIYLIISCLHSNNNMIGENQTSISSEVFQIYPYSFPKSGTWSSVYDNRFAHCNRLLHNHSLHSNETRRLKPLKDLGYYLNLNSPSENACLQYKGELNIHEIPISDEEKGFPLAFSILAYKDINQVARLLRIIHRPHNFYVIHVDRKSPQELYNSVVEIQRCFGNNVLVIPRLESVQAKWGTYTLLEIEFLCAERLLLMGKWKYLINLTGQEFPLRTNLEIVMALEAINGSNIAESVLKKQNFNRIPNVTLDFNVTWIKGAVHAVLKREFVEFMLSDQKALSIASALKEYSFNKSPVELFFSTLIYNPQLGTPGACSEIHEKSDSDVQIDRLGLIIRYKKWNDEPCPTKFLRTICILGSAHLNILFHAKELFANKFLENFYPEAYDCLESMIALRAKEKQVFDTSIYENLYCSRDHI